jgi:hypothetical protein
MGEIFGGGNGAVARSTYLSRRRRKTIYLAIISEECKNPEYQVKIGIQSLNKIMGQNFGGCGGAVARSTYIGRRRRKNNLVSNYFGGIVKILNIR